MILIKVKRMVCCPWKHSWQHKNLKIDTFIIKKNTCVIFSNELSNKSVVKFDLPRTLKKFKSIKYKKNCEEKEKTFRIFTKFLKFYSASNYFLENFHHNTFIFHMSLKQNSIITMLKIESNSLNFKIMSEFLVDFSDI